MRTQLSIVIPVYDEEDSIVRLHHKITKIALTDDYEIIFVNDGSTDNTQRVLEKIYRKDHCVRVIKFARNFGQGSALNAGMKMAKGSLIVTIDGDLQNDPADIPRLMKALADQDCDFICGWRRGRRDSLSKKLYSKIANIIRMIIFNERFHDAGCTMRIYRKKCIKDLNISGEMHRFMPTILHLHGFRSGELVIRHHPRRFGETKYSSLRLIRGLKDMIIVRAFPNRFFSENHDSNGYVIEKVLRRTGD
ncbi:MAG: glycosyltransferase family 2 protein [archaeon]